MTPGAAPFYTDWTFWAFVTSALAVILSQLPPIRHWFRGPTLVIETADQMRIAHGMGYPIAGIVLSVRNVGGSSARIKSLAFKFRRDNKDLIELPITDFHPNPLTNDTLMVMPFTMVANVELTRSFNGYFDLTRDGYRHLHRLTSDVRRDIGQKVDLVKRHGGDPTPLVLLDEKLVHEARDTFEKNFIWRSGEYEVVVLITTESKCPVKQQALKFTLWESDETELRELVDDYKYGFGIGVVSDKHAKGIFVKLRSS